MLQKGRYLVFVSIDQITIATISLCISHFFFYKLINPAHWAYVSESITEREAAWLNLLQNFNIDHLREHTFSGDQEK